MGKHENASPGHSQGYGGGSAPAATGMQQGFVVLIIYIYEEKDT